VRLLLPILLYSSLKFPLGSVCSASSSQVMTDCCQSNGGKSFQLIVDSGCTRHMFPFCSLFTSYKETPSSYVVLADKSKVACLGSSTVKFSLREKTLILHDVLHILSLCSPLYQFGVFILAMGVVS
jgi:hypothetical protein